MRVVVTGATGNVGTAVVAALVARGDVDVVGVARRRPDWSPAQVEWRQVDVATDPLGPLLAGADAVIHLAWLIQPVRDVRLLHQVNVVGSRRVAEAVMDFARARDELGWQPARSATGALEDLVAGFADRAGMATPPLRPGGGGTVVAPEPWGTGPATVRSRGPA